MIQPIGNSLTCIAQFTKNNAGVTGLSVTVDVYKVKAASAALLVTAASAAQIAKGAYYYTLAVDEVDEEALYLFIFSAPAGSADLIDVVQGWTVGTGWVENLDAALSDIEADTQDLQARINRRAELTGGDARRTWADIGIGESYTLAFRLLDENGDPVTGATPEVTLSKNGAAFAAASGTIAEVGNGVYSLEADVNDLDTQGPLILHATAAGATPAIREFAVTRTDPFNGESTDRWGYVDNIPGIFDEVNALASKMDALTEEETPDEGDWRFTAQALEEAPGADASSIAAAVWNALTSGLTTVGSIGKLLVDKMSLLVSGTPPTLISTTPSTGILTLVVGDAYTEGHSRSVSFPIEEPDLTGAVVKLHIGILTNAVQTGLLTVTGEVSNPGTENQFVRFEYPASYTSVLGNRVATGAYHYQIRAVWPADSPSEPATIGTGRVDTVRQIPEAV